MMATRPEIKSPLRRDYRRQAYIQHDIVDATITRSSSVLIIDTVSSLREAWIHSREAVCSSPADLGTGVSSAYRPRGAQHPVPSCYNPASSNTLRRRGSEWSL